MKSLSTLILSAIVVLCAMTGCATPLQTVGEAETPGALAAMVRPQVDYRLAGGVPESITTQDDGPTASVGLAITSGTLVDTTEPEAFGPDGEASAAE